MGTESKFQSFYLTLQHLEFWNSHDHPSFPLFYLLSCSKVYTFLIFLQSIQSLQYLEERFGANCITNCSTQLLAGFLYNKLLDLWVCTFLEDEKSIPELCHQKTQNPLTTFI